jgi:hypothetical protein
MQKFPVSHFYLIKFKKIFSSHNNIREDADNGIIGYAPYLPVKDVHFLMFAKGTLEGSIRIIKTTEINDINLPDESNPRLYSIKTRNSIYEILILDRVESNLVEEFIEKSLIEKDPAIERFMEKLDEEIPKNLN